VSNECSTVVWKRDFGTLTRKVIAARLADHADDEGRGIWPSVERVAAQCNTSTRTVQRTLAGFVDEGILKIVSEGGRGPGSTTRYDFNMRILEALPLAMWGPDKGDTVSPLGESKGDTDDAKGDTGDTKGRQGVTQTSIEPPLEPSDSREGTSECENGHDANSVEPAEPAQDRKAIERAFWALVKDWPNFAGMPKEAALPAWMALTDEERDLATRRFPGWLALLKAQKKSHFPAPSTYFRSKLFLEVAEAPKANAAPEQVAPFGKAGMAYRFWILNQPERGHPTAPFMIQRMIDEGGPVADAEITKRRAAYSWPRLVELDRRTIDVSERDKIRVSANIVALGADFTSVELGGPVGEAWKRLFRRMRMPFLPVLPGRPDEPKYAYLPPIEAGADDLDKAVAAAWWTFAERCKGHADAA